MKRYISPIYPGGSWTDDEIDEDLKRTIVELREIDNDDAIVRHDEPTIEELKEIIHKAKSYTGSWYHSKVTLPGWFISKEYSLLQKEVEELGQNAGIVISHQMPSTPEQEEFLKKLFESRNSR